MCTRKPCAREWVWRWGSQTRGSHRGTCPWSVEVCMCLRWCVGASLLSLSLQFLTPPLLQACSDLSHVPGISAAGPGAATSQRVGRCGGLWRCSGHALRCGGDGVGCRPGRQRVQRARSCSIRGRAGPCRNGRHAEQPNGRRARARSAVAMAARSSAAAGAGSRCCSRGWEGRRRKGRHAEHPHGRHVGP